MTEVIRTPAPHDPSHALYIGLMSGTSLDGVDAVLLELTDNAHRVRHAHFLPFSPELRQALLQLQLPGSDELERAAIASNQLSRLYADVVLELVAAARLTKDDIHAIGCHGQTIRHRPEIGFTLQIGNPALLAELTGITTVADFRSRDIAAGGQGAPLAPAFHQAVFRHDALNRAIINIGGIANITYLPAGRPTTGFDSGPGNMLMNAWIEKNSGLTYDKDGQWAASGNVIETLLKTFSDEPFFALPPPKSTGRDLFNLAWLEARIGGNDRPEDVQRTLLELTAQSIALAVAQHCGDVEEIYLCGGGAHNRLLVARLHDLLRPVKIEPTDALGIPVHEVEGAAFAWLAQQTLHRKSANLPAVTGASGTRILGAIHYA